MKKIILFSAVFLSLACSSCRKDWTCTCKDSSGATTSQTPILLETKSQAKTTCNNLATSGETCSI